MHIPSVGADVCKDVDISFLRVCSKSWVPSCGPHEQQPPVRVTLTLRTHGLFLGREERILLGSGHQCASFTLREGRAPRWENLIVLSDFRGSGCLGMGGTMPGSCASLAFSCPHTPLNPQLNEPRTKMQPPKLQPVELSASKGVWRLIVNHVHRGVSQIYWPEPCKDSFQ